MSRLDDSELVRFEGAYGLKKEGYRKLYSETISGKVGVASQNRKPSVGPLTSFGREKLAPS